jgi:DNA-binding transcriptional LysR family regulator
MAVNLNRLAVLVAVVEAGSFTAAAARLGLTKARVSQHITALEAELGTALLVRTTRRLRTTEAGQAFVADCARILRETDTAIARVARSAGDAPSGTLRVTVAASHIPAIIAPALAALARDHPDLAIEVLATDAIIDLVAAGVDIAVRVGWLGDSRLRRVRLGAFRQVVIAAPSYLERFGRPRHPRDLAAHRWIALSALRAPLSWTFMRGAARTRVRVAAPIRASAPAAVHALVVAGAGITALLDDVVAPDIAVGRLEPLLTEYTLPEAGIYAVHPPLRHVPAKTRAFIDALRERMKGGP